MRFRAKREELATWAHLDRRHFVRIGYLGHGCFLITVPEQDWRSLPCGDELQFIVMSLGHATVRAIGGLPPVNTLFLFEVVGAD